MALLEISAISKHFAGLRALQNVTMQVEEGTIHSIIGPNGAGKSTLLNVMTGRLEPDHGDVTFDGRSLRGLKPYEVIRRGIARVFQTPEIFPDMTVLENVVMSLLSGRDGKFRFNILQTRRQMAGELAEAEALLHEMRLERFTDLPAMDLSRGDKRRLELAVCLAHKPRLLLLDEPTAGMSQHETQGTIELLRSISKRGMTKVIIEHDMHLVFTLSDRITVLHQGEVIADGTPDAVRENDRVQDAYLGAARQ